MENFTKIYYIMAIADLILGIVYLSTTAPLLTYRVYSEYVKITEEIMVLKSYYADTRDTITDIQNTEMSTKKDYDHLAILLHRSNQYGVLVEEKETEKIEFQRVIALVAVMVLYGVSMIVATSKLIRMTLKEKNLLIMHTCSCFYWIVSNAVSLGFLLVCWYFEVHSFGLIIDYLKSNGEAVLHLLLFCLSFRVVCMLTVSVSTFSLLGHKGAVVFNTM